jgi:hypothetical protein
MIVPLFAIMGMILYREGWGWLVAYRREVDLPAPISPVMAVLRRYVRDYKDDV